MLNVFLTVDTELSVLPPHWKDDDLRRMMSRDIYGGTASGDFGLPYQITTLNRYGLKGVFFVEGLFADAVGDGPLREIVNLIVSGGHEVQVHLHTEWLPRMRQPVLDHKRGANLKEFTEEEQTKLVGRAIENLRACGASNLCAFRAGNYGANFDTLRALGRNDISIDTSYNVYYLQRQCALRLPSLLNQPAEFSGVYEFPIAFFRDWPGHHRHVQLTACSFAEIAGALFEAWRRDWFSFVIVSHSFELLNGVKRHRGASVADPVVRQRFEKLCQLLHDHRDKFQTMFFRDVDAASIPQHHDTIPLSSPLHRTAWRYVQQLARRIS